MLPDRETPAQVTLLEPQQLAQVGEDRDEEDRVAHLLVVVTLAADAEDVDVADAVDVDVVPVVVDAATLVVDVDVADVVPPVVDAVVDAATLVVDVTVAVLVVLLAARPVALAARPAAKLAANVALLVEPLADVTRVLETTMLNVKPDVKLAANAALLVVLAALLAARPAERLAEDAATPVRPLRRQHAAAATLVLEWKTPALLS